jgi:hypothetical protein
MCGPLLIPLVTLAISAAGTAMSYSQQASQAKKQEQAIRADQENRYAAMAEKNNQTVRQEAGALLEVRRQQQREAASARVASGEAGVTGVSMDSILNDTFMQAGFESSRIIADTQARLKQNELEAKGIASQSESAYNSINRPSAVAAGLQIAGSALKAYNSYSQSGGGK